MSYQGAQRLIDRGCEVFLVTVVAIAEQLAPTVSDILVVMKFTNVFLEEVPGFAANKRGRIWD